MFYSPLNEMAGPARELVSNSTPIMPNYTGTWDSNGLRMDAQYAPRWKCPYNGTTDEITTLVFSEFAPTTNKYYLSNMDGTAVSPPAGMWVLGTIGTTNYGFNMWNGGGWVNLNVTGVNDNLPHVYMGVKRMSGSSMVLAVYKDGILGAQSSPTTNYNISSALQSIGFGPFGGDTASWSTYQGVGTRRVAAVWNRALSPAEIASISANPWQLLAQSSARSILDRLSQFVLWDAALTLGAAPGWSGSAQARFSAGAGFPAVSGFSDMGNAQLLALADLTGITALSPAALAQLKGALALSSGAALSPALTAQLLAGLNLTALAALQQEYPGAVAYLLRMLLSGGAPLISATGAAPTIRATGGTPTITFSGE